MRTIGIHLPDKSHFHSESDYIFVRELEKTLKESGRYKTIRLRLKKIKITSEETAKAYLKKNNLHFVVQHDSAFYSSSLKYKNTVQYLEKQVPFFNSVSSQKIGHDKIATKRLLKRKQIPVLDDCVVDSPETLRNCMENTVLYVVKPSNGGAGSGVRLIKKQGENIMRYVHGRWKDIEVGGGGESDGVRFITLQHKQNTPALVGIAALFALAVFFPLHVPAYAIAGLFIVMLAFDLLTRMYERKFIYSPMLVEPFFNDSEERFSSLRCTVIGDEVVEAVKRTNVKDITSNISNGGTAERFELSAEQKKMAVDAKNAIGADYAGVDLLVRGNKSVVGEVNIGPFTLFCTYTGVNVGKIFGEYLIRKCDGM